MILKRILSGGEVSRLHRDGEGYTFTDTREPHHNRPPAFSLTPQAQRKSLAKRNADKGISPLRRRGWLRALHRRELLKKLDQNFNRKKRRLNVDLFEKD